MGVSQISKSLSRFEFQSKLPRKWVGNILSVDKSVLHSLSDLWNIIK